MKNLKTILVVVATANILHAQDTIYTKNGKAIPAKVYEITQHEIRYQNSSNLEGPIYTIDKNSVSLIEYKNGTKDVFSGDESSQSQANQSQPSQSNTSGNYSDDVYNQGQPGVTNNYYSSGYGGNSSYYNPGVSLSFMFGMPSLFWGVPYYAGPWGGWPYYRSYYRPYWAYNYYRPWYWNGYAWGGGGWYGGYGWGWRGNHGGHYGGYHGGYHNGGYYGGHRGGGYYGPRGGHRMSSGSNGGGFINHGGYHGGTGSFHGNGGYHGGGGGHGFGGGGFHGGGGGHSGGGGHGGGHR